MRAIRSMVMVGAAVAAVSLAGATSAFADPTTPPWPSLNAIVGVGSDTTTPVFDALVPAYNSANPSPDPQLASWDAVNPTTGAVGDEIITKTSDPDDNPPTDLTCQMARPDGSSQGIAALETGTQDQGSYCIDFARSSRPPLPTDPNTVAFVNLAGDAIDWSTPAGTSADPSPVPSDLTLTLQDLLGIYTCSITNWDQVGGSDATITPVVPQSGSGTRATFLLALGALDGLAAGTQLPIDTGSGDDCVVNGADSEGNPVEENTGVTIGNQDVFGTAADPIVGSIFPYSIADYIAQTGDSHATSVWAPGPLELGDVVDDSGNTQAPITGTGTSEAINSSFPTELKRTIYDVVRNANTAASPEIPSYLEGVFGSSGWLCGSTAQSILASYGFSSSGFLCGTATDESLTYPSS
jgi:ABC-type phosphate transport system substrate-binding protein